MTRRQLLATVTVLMLALCGDAVARQSAPAPSGHWVGTLEAGVSLAVEVDLALQGGHIDLASLGKWRVDDGQNTMQISRHHQSPTLPSR